MKTERDEAVKEHQEKLEARIVALTLGEVSEFERADLEREIAQSARLGAFAKEMAALVRLTRAALAGPDADGPRLREEKRRALRDELGLGGEGTNQPGNSSGGATPGPALSAGRVGLDKGIPLLAMAACFVLAAGILMLYVTRGDFSLGFGGERSGVAFSDGVADSGRPSRESLLENKGPDAVGFGAADTLSMRQSVLNESQAVPQAKSSPPPAARAAAPVEDEMLSRALSQSVAKPAMPGEAMPEEISSGIRQFTTAWGADRLENRDARAGAFANGVAEGSESLRRPREVMPPPAAAPSRQDADGAWKDRGSRGSTAVVESPRRQEERRELNGMALADAPAQMAGAERMMLSKDHSLERMGDVEGTVHYGALLPLTSEPSG
ncbi:MAG: hypothetical protein SNJ52_05415, partial [Verrucomicrobiia bacterium]